MKAGDLDAVTLDAHGTLVRLADPVPALTNALSERGVERAPEAVLAGFQAEVAHYAPRASEGHDEESLARLQRECVGVFLEAVDADLAPDEFGPAYIGALHFDVLPGVVESLDRLQALGLELAVVANWTSASTGYSTRRGLPATSRWWCMLRASLHPTACCAHLTSSRSIRCAHCTSVTTTPIEAPPTRPACSSRRHRSLLP